MAVPIPKMPSPKEQDLVALADLVRRELPPSYLQFANLHDGAEPEENTFPVGTNNESGVRTFISVADAARVLLEVEGFPPRYVPLAEDDLGNFVYVDPTSERVFFWDHELEGPDQELASSIAEFLERLLPFDPSSVQLAAGQVISVWVDPTFKPEFD